jgi:hypothetical protein
LSVEESPHRSAQMRFKRGARSNSRPVLPER